MATVRLSKNDVFCRRHAMTDNGLRICLDIRCREGGGVAVYIDQLVPQLLNQGKGHQFLLLRHQEQKIGSWDTESVMVPPMNHWRELLWVQRTLPLILRQQGVQVYHALKHMGPLTPGCRSLLSLHEVGQYLEARTLPLMEHAYWRYLQPRSLRRVDHIIAVSGWVRDFVVSRLGVNGSRVSIVPLGVNPAFHDDPGPEARANAMKRLKIPTPYLLAVGNVSPKKNLGTIVTALARLKQDGIDIPHLVIAGGDGYRASEVYALAAEAGLGDHVHRTGFVNTATLAALYREAETLVYPSLYESFGLPPIEAMACGCAVITSRKAAIPEITGGYAWYLKSPTDADELAAIIRRMRSNRREKRERIAAGRDWVRRYDWEKTARVTLDLYRRVFSAGRTS